MSSDAMNYNPNLTNSGRMAKQTVRLTFAMWDYRHTTEVVIGGNCTGLTVIEAAVERCHTDLPNAPAPYDSDNIPVIYMDGPQGRLEVVDEEGEGEDWLKDMLVSAEIVSITKDEETAQ